jgi:hypothetical protein
MAWDVASRVSPLVRLAGRAVVALLGCAIAILGASPARAQAAVDLQLVLALDASGSVSEERFILQQRGYAAAFRDPRLLEAIRAGAQGAIAVTMMQWTGPALQAQVVPWMRIDSEASLRAIADTIEGTPRQLFGGGTSISGAIDQAVALIARSGFASVRRIIDVSGDGANNRGRPAGEARDDALRAGVGINGLPILTLEPDLEHYYLDNVIGGPGAFVVVAESYESFAHAVKKKLFTEIAGVAIRPSGRGCGRGCPRQRQPATDHVDVFAQIVELIGEPQGHREQVDRVLDAVDLVHGPVDLGTVGVGDGQGFDSLQLAVPIDDASPHAPGVQRRGEAQGREQNADGRQQQHDQAVGERRQPEGQVALQERRPRLVDSRRIDRQREFLIIDARKSAGALKHPGLAIGIEHGLCVHADGGLGQQVDKRGVEVFAHEQRGSRRQDGGVDRRYVLGEVDDALLQFEP